MLDCNILVASFFVKNGLNHPISEDYDICFTLLHTFCYF